jgi:hypothetical protein
MKNSRERASKTFSRFPEFSKLTLGDRCSYEKLVADYPPITDIQFASLMVWWNWLDTCAISILNDNLVISYWFPGEERFSGLSLIGTHDIDGSICTVFDVLREKGEDPRLVHMPEFVLASIEHPEMFIVEEERGFDEYIFPISHFYPLHHMPGFRRKRIKKFLENVDGDHLVLKPVDLSQLEARRTLLEHGEIWQKQSGKLSINKVAKVETEALLTSITLGDLIGMECVGLYEGEELLGFCIFHRPSDKRYAIFSHARINPLILRVLDYMVYAVGRWLTDEGITFVNLEYDLGIPFLRMFKLALGPSNYFRKYTVKPRYR